MTWFFVLSSLLPFYALGAFPSGFLVAKAHGIDIRGTGSGNVGATNVARVVGKKAGILTLILDVSKGLFGVLAASVIAPAMWYTVSAGVALVMGHCLSFPPFLKGGKGVATALGVVCALSWPSALVGIAAFLIVFGSTRIVSLASVTAALAVPVAGFFLSPSDSISLAFGTIACLVTFRHKANLVRLSQGREPKFAFRRSSASPG